jgi:hypothetical protein
VWIVMQYFLLLVQSWLIKFPASAPYDGPLGAVYVGLAIAPTAGITWQSTMANITEANYDGYARQEVVWYPPYLAGGGPATLEGQSLHFAPTDATVPNNIIGVFLADAPTGGHLLAFASWPGTGAPMSNPSQALTVDAFFQLPFQLVYGGPEMTN